MRLKPQAEPTELAERITRQRGGVHGPFQALLRSPGLGDRAEALATYCTAGSVLPLPLRELALLMGARHFGAWHSWNAHVGRARAAGVDAEALERLARGEEPRFPDPDDDLLYRFATEVLREHFVSDETFAAGLEQFGERGLVDLIGCLGNSVLMAMLLKAFEI